MHIWDAETAKPGVLDALDKGIIMTSFFSPLADTGIPVARSDEAGISYAMGAEMATQWKAAHPDKPIVMAQLGWPNHTEVKSGRTDPWVEGVLSVDPTATDLGCLDASKGPDTAKQIILDLVTQHPEVNLIYSEASNLTVGTMAALTQAGRGKMEDGKPLTEIVASVDFDEVEMKQVYDPNSSLKLSMGLPPSRDWPWPHRPDHGYCDRQGSPDLPARKRALLQGLQCLLLDHARGRCRELAQHPVRHQHPVTTRRAPKS